MANVAHTAIATWQRNQSPLISQPKNLDRNLRCKLCGCSLWPSCEGIPVLGVIAINEDAFRALFSFSSLSFRLAIIQSNRSLNQATLNFLPCIGEKSFAPYSAAEDLAYGHPCLRGCF